MSELVTVLPADKRLKQLVREHGTVWSIKEDRSVACFGWERGLYVASLDGKHERWVRSSHVSWEIA